MRKERKSMSNRFDSKEVFKERFKLEVSEMYGRNFEETSSIERYQVLGHMIRDYVGINWRETKMRSKRKRQSSYIISPWNF